MSLHAALGTTVTLGTPTGSGTAASPTTVTFTTAGLVASTYETWNEDGLSRRRNTHRGITDITTPSDGRGSVVARTIGADTERLTWTRSADPRATLAGVEFTSSAVLDRGIAPDVYLGATRTEAIPCTTATVATDCGAGETCVANACTGTATGEYTEDVGVSSVPVTDPTTGDYWRTRVNRVGTEWHTTTTPPAGTTWNTTVRRDSRGRVIQINLPSAHPICITYPTSTAVRPSLIRMSAACAATAGRRDVALTWDAQRRPATVTAGYSPSSLLTTLTYSTLRPFPTSIRAPGRTLTDEARATYDAFGNVTRFEPHGSHPTERHEFVLGGRELLVSYTSPANSSTPEIGTAVYTADGDLDSVTLRGGRLVDPTWTAGVLDTLAGTPTLGTYDVTSDIAGRLTSAVGPDGTTGFVYDGSMLRTQTWAEAAGPVGVAGSVTAVLDGTGLLDYEDVSILPGGPSRRVEYAYGTTGAARRLRITAGLDWPVGGAVERNVVVGTTVSTTAGLSLRVQATSVLGTNVVATTDLSDLLELAISSTTAAGTPVYQEEICLRDNLGRVTRRAEVTRDTVAGAATNTVYEYQYDAYGRLSGYRVANTAYTCSQAAAGSCTFPAYTTYTYDTWGNRIGTFTGAAVAADDRVNGGTTTPRTYDEPGRTSNVTIASGITEAFTWDELSRMTRRSGTAFGSTSHTDFDYDALGRLIAISVVPPLAPTPAFPNQRFTYRDGLRPIAWAYQTTSGGPWNTAYFVYATEGRVPDLMTVDLGSNGVLDATDPTYRLATDARGSVRVLIDNATGNAVQRTSYDAWGVATDSITGDRRHPFGFAGGLNLNNGPLTLFGARIYDARVGRWLSKDPISFEGGHNLYVYCGNDPVNRVDPTGLSDIFGSFAAPELSGPGPSGSSWNLLLPGIALSTLAGAAGGNFGAMLLGANGDAAGQATSAGGYLGFFGGGLALVGFGLAGELTLGAVILVAGGALFAGVLVGALIGWIASNQLASQICGIEPNPRIRAVSDPR